jgi:DedD protein
VTASRHRQGEQAGTGWLATLSGALLLLAVGFAVGLLAGTVWEAPDLVMAYLAGRTTELPLAQEISADPVEPAEAPKRESHARPLGARAVPPELPSAGVAAEGARVSAPPPPPPAEPPAPRPGSPAPGGLCDPGGALRDATAAAAAAGKLKARGFSAYVHGGEGAGPASFRVRVGPVASREEATRLASKLKSDLRLPTWILSPDSR